MNQNEIDEKALGDFVKDAPIGLLIIAILALSALGLIQIVRLI